MNYLRTFVPVIVVVCIYCTNTAWASFHLMQIQQVIGGVNGDTTAQAIQLRMRSAFQNQLQSAQLWARDATGSNPVQLINFGTSVTNQGTGVTILVSSPNFADFTNVPLASDFTLTNLIPESYLAAGQITFEDNVGNVYWALNFGGSGYTGSTIGLVTNDSDGDFGPPFDGPLPSSSTGALQFQGPATAQSTTNLADYAVTSGPAVFQNNAGTQFTVNSLCDFNGDSACDIDDIDALVAEIVAGTNDPLFDLTADGVVTLEDATDPDVGWLRLAGEENLGEGLAYLPADITLDGIVDGLDFLEWNMSKFMVTGLWSLGDVNADGVTDGLDFIVWNDFKFTSSNSVSAVPEPGAVVLSFFALVLLGITRRRRHVRSPSKR